MVVIAYFKKLFSIWYVYISVLLDIIAIIAVASGKTLILPTWAYWLLAALFFVISNITIYADMDKKIKEYERPRVSRIG